MSTFKGFTTVELKKPTRSVFDMSHEKRVSFKMGQLVPVLITETIPNDTWRCNTEIMLRLAPLLAPIMHRVNCFVHYFYVPNRLLWSDWEDFITGGRLGTETPPVPPFFKFSTAGSAGESILDNGSLFDYLGGNPTDDATCASLGDRSLDLMPFAAYNKVYQDYYRDRNFVTDNDVLPLLSAENGGRTAGEVHGLIRLRNRDFQKDYFTSALPWTQRGNEVLMPLVGSGNVTYLPTSLHKTTAGGNPAINTVVGTNAGTGEIYVGKTAFAGTGGTGRIENIQSVNINSSGVSINDLRRSIRLQEWLERNALAGSRYTESIRAHFAKVSSDARLQRAEYLGGGKVTIKISEIVTTAWSVDGATNEVPPANMAGHGISFGNTNRFTYNCEEHGFIVGIMSVMPNTAYMQGLPRMFRERRTFLDYPWPSFAHLGEQPVYKYELFMSSGNIPVDRSTSPVFGYQSRYADWKYIPSSSHGDFRTTLDFWHLTRKFANDPVLGFLFNNFDTTLPDRIFAVSGVQQLWAYIYNDASVKRSLPYYGTPQL